jgi:hypothetical protein
MIPLSNNEEVRDMEYEVIDTITGFSIEPGDRVRLWSGEEFVVLGVEGVDNGYNLRYRDEFEDDDLVIFVEEDEFVELLG